MTITIEIHKIIVLTGVGIDEVFIQTAFSQPLWPYESTGATLRISTGSGRGKDWVEEKFGIIPEVIRKEG